MSRLVYISGLMSTALASDAVAGHWQPKNGVCGQAATTTTGRTVVAASTLEACQSICSTKSSCTAVEFDHTVPHCTVLTQPVTGVLSSDGHVTCSVLTKEESRVENSQWGDEESPSPEEESPSPSADVESPTPDDDSWPTKRDPTNSKWAEDESPSPEEESPSPNEDSPSPTDDDPSFLPDSGLPWVAATKYGPKTVVLFQGALYQAQWTTVGELPGLSQAWVKLSGPDPHKKVVPSPSPDDDESPSPDDDESPSPDEDSPSPSSDATWSPTVPYYMDAVVLYEGVQYRAQWWNIGEKPSTSMSWVKVTDPVTKDDWATLPGHCEVAEKGRHLVKDGARDLDSCQKDCLTTFGNDCLGVQFGSPGEYVGIYGAGNGRCEFLTESPTGVYTGPGRYLCSTRMGNVDPKEAHSPSPDDDESPSPDDDESPSPVPVVQSPSPSPDDDESPSPTVQEQSPVASSPSPLPSPEVPGNPVSKVFEVTLGLTPEQFDANTFSKLLAPVFEVQESELEVVAVRPGSLIATFKISQPGDWDVNAFLAKGNTAKDEGRLEAIHPESYFTLASVPDPDPVDPVDPNSRDAPSPAPEDNDGSNSSLYFLLLLLLVPVFAGAAAFWYMRNGKGKKHHDEIVGDVEVGGEKVVERATPFGPSPTEAGDVFAVNSSIATDMTSSLSVSAIAPIDVVGKSPAQSFVAPSEAVSPKLAPTSLAEAAVEDAAASVFNLSPVGSVNFGTVVNMEAAKTAVNVETAKRQGTVSFAPEASVVNLSPVASSVNFATVVNMDRVNTPVPRSSSPVPAPVDSAAVPAPIDDTPVCHLSPVASRVNMATVVNMDR